MNRRFFLMSIACLAIASWVAAKSPMKVIAHRGYWKTEGSAQNSLRALEKAAEVMVYGSEFDVHLTADNVLVVNHDNDIQGKPIQTSTYAELKDLKLPNGECIPTLEQYLLKAKEKGNRKVRLIFELKPHQTPERNQEAARRCVEMVNQLKLAKRTEYISFNLDACKELIRQAPKADVYYLNGELSPKELKELGFAGLDYHYKVLRTHPEWVQQCKAMGLKSNVWTVDDTAVMREMRDMGVDFLTTNQPEEALQIMNE